MQKKPEVTDLGDDTYSVSNTRWKNINFTNSRSYSQAIANSTLINENETNDTTEIKELLKQSIKNTEILTKMIIEQNAILKQQTQ